MCGRCGVEGVPGHSIQGCWLTSRLLRFGHLFWFFRRTTYLHHFGKLLDFSDFDLCISQLLVCMTTGAALVEHERASLTQMQASRHLGPTSQLPNGFSALLPQRVVRVLCSLLPTDEGLGNEEL